MFWPSIFLAVISIAVYHLFQKSISPTIHPIITLIISYSISLAFCFFLILFFPLKKDIVTELKQANWATYLLGIAIFGIELGYLLAYRSGGKLSLVNPISMTASTILITSAGILFFRESMTSVKIMGIIFCVLGVALLNLK